MIFYGLLLPKKINKKLTYILDTIWTQAELAQYLIRRNRAEAKYLEKQFVGLNVYCNTGLMKTNKIHFLIVYIKE